MMRRMKSVEKQKICPSCEARVSLEAEVCPFCAYEINSHVAKPQNQLFQSQSLEDSLASLYKPPYQGKRLPTPEEASPEPRRPMKQKNVEAALYGQSAEEEIAETKEKKSSLIPTMLLIAASNLFLIGLMLLFFSTSGSLQLEFDATNWFYYCVAALPLFYFGWKKLQEID